MRTRWVLTASLRNRSRPRGAARRRARQLELPVPGPTGRGGFRRRAGRKPKGPSAGVPHVARPALARPFLAHVTVRLGEHVYQIRSRRGWRIVGRALDLGGDRFGMRVCHYSVQSRHLHLIVEARDARALSRGMQGLGIRLARGVNRLMRRRGRVVADRYHARLLGTPLEVRRALLYVLNNARRHAAQRGPEALAALPCRWIDPFSSAAAFDGWREPCFCPREGPPVWGVIWPRPPWAPPLRAIETAEIAHGDGVGAGGAALLRHLARRPRTWLLAAGWRRHGLLEPDAVPGGPRAR